MSDETFEGFIPPTKNYFPMPNEWIDICARIDNLAELKVIQYVLRHTWGFREYGITKTISVDEFMKGRKRHDGTRMDNGTGLKSDRSVKDGIRAAIKHGYLIHEVDTSDPARTRKSYALKMIGTGVDTTPPVDTTPVNDENTGVVSTPLTGSIYPPQGYNLPPRQVDTTPRTEKDTIERHLEKNTLEKQESIAPTSLSEFAERKKATDHQLVAITKEMLAEKVIAPKITLPSKQKPAASADGEAVMQPPQGQVGRTPDVAPSASVGAGTAQAGAGKRTQEKKKVTQANEPQQVPRCSTKEIQARINAHRGYALEEEVEIIRERKAIKTWCNLHELADYDTTMQHLKHDPYWGKSENYYRIGGLTLLKETPKVLAAVGRQRESSTPGIPRKPALTAADLRKAREQQARAANG